MKKQTPDLKKQKLKELLADFYGDEFFSKSEKYKIRICEEWEKDDSPSDDYFFDSFTFLLPNRHVRQFTPPKNVDDLWSYVDDYKDADDIVRKLERQFGKGNVFPLSALCHGCCFLYIGTHRVDAWDSGLMGFLVLDAKEARKNVRFSKKFKKSDFAESLIKEWNHYMNEPDYRFEIYEFDEDEDDYELTESICGYRSQEFAKEEALAIAESAFGSGWQDK